jgi:hypothetical protein
MSTSKKTQNNNNKKTQNNNNKKTQNNNNSADTNIMVKDSTELGLASLQRNATVSRETQRQTSRGETNKKIRKSDKRER